MRPEEAQRQRDLALKNAIIGLGRLPSHELAPDGTRASGILYELQQRIAAIEVAAGPAGEPRHVEGSEDERVERVMQEFAARGLGRV